MNSNILNNNPMKLKNNHPRSFRRRPNYPKIKTKSRD